MAVECRRTLGLLIEGNRQKSSSKGLLFCVDKKTGRMAAARGGMVYRNNDREARCMI